VSTRYADDLAGCAVRIRRQGWDVFWTWASNTSLAFKILKMRKTNVTEYKQDFRFEDGVLEVRLSGKFPDELLRQGKNLFQPLVDACLSYQCRKALIDARHLEVNFGTMAMFQAGKDAGSMGRAGIRIALLARDDMIDSFFEDVAANRGGDIAVFTDMDAARTWLER
jgi:hypothetical protein